jgi:hypothetical protein
MRLKNLRHTFPDDVIGFVLLQTYFIPLHLYVKLQKEERKKATEGKGGGMGWDSDLEWTRDKLQ